jgi:hypothetical protein
MKRNSIKTVEAVIETKSLEGEPPWSISNSGENYIRVYAGASDEEIGSIMLAACLTSSGEIIKETASDTLKAFISDEGFVLSGGLVFKENGDIKVSPGCCNGLENWYEWLAVPNGGCEIWTGHDPESLIEINNGKIKIWHDRTVKNESLSIEFTVEELIERLEDIEKDLKGFVFRLRKWAKDLSPELENRVADHFAKNMNIKI